MSEIPKTSSQNRLKLQRLNSNSSQFYNKEKKLEERKLDKETCEISENRRDSSEEDESLADFRSPKSPETNTKARFKVDVRSPRCKKRLLAGKSKSGAKSKPATSKGRKNVPRDRNQPAIESSFFKNKLEELPTVFVCPLCLRSSKDEGVHNVHMKLCANKNNITPKELLDAIQLQERQAEERKALGLVSAPLLQQTKKPTLARLKKFVSCDDPELQLALAISKSLHEAEQIEQLDECEALAEAAGQPIIITSEEERRKTLQSFGFTSNKPLVETKIRSKKKKHVGLTVLQTRSETDKRRILTERIAEILVGKDLLSQTQPDTTDCLTGPRKTLPLKSQLLRNIIQVDNPLWVSSSLIQVYCDYFLIDSVAKYLSPTKKHNLELREYSSTETEQETRSTSKSDSCPEILSSSPNMIDPEEDLNSASVREVLENWADTLNDSSMSDLLIFTKNMRQIWGHKLVFHTRAPAILNDIQSYENPRFPAIKDQITWENVERNVAMAFLEYVYCGRIKSNSDMLRDQAKLTELRKLARRYQMIKLFEYLRLKTQQTSPVDVKKKFIGTKVEPRAELREGTQSSDDMFDDDSNTQASQNTIKNESLHLEDCLDPSWNSESTLPNKRESQSGTDQSSLSQNTSSQNKSAENNNKKSQSQKKSGEDSAENQYFSFSTHSGATEETNDNVGSDEHRSTNSDVLNKSLNISPVSQPCATNRMNVLRVKNFDDMMTEDESPVTDIDDTNVTIRSKTLTQSRAERELINPLAKRKEATVKRRSAEEKSTENSAAKITSRKDVGDKSSSNEDFLSCVGNNSQTCKESRLKETEDAEDSLVIETPPKVQINQSRLHATSWEESQPSTSREGQLKNHNKEPDKGSLIDLTIFDEPSIEVRQETVKRKTKSKTPPSARSEEDAMIEEVPLESVTEAASLKKKRSGEKREAVTRVSEYMRVLQTERDSDDSLSSIVQLINPMAKNIARKRFIKSKSSDELAGNKRHAISMLEKELAGEEPSCARFCQYDRRHSKVSTNLAKLCKVARSLRHRAKSQLALTSPSERKDSSDSIIYLSSTPEKVPETPKTPAKTPRPPQIRSIERIDKEVRMILSPVLDPAARVTPQKRPVVSPMVSLDSINATESEDESPDMAELSQYSKYRKTNENCENSIAVYREALFQKSSSSTSSSAARKRSAPEDTSSSKKPRIDQQNRTKRQEKEEKSRRSRRTSFEKDSASSGSESSDDDTLNADDPDEVKRRLKKRGFKNWGRFKNHMLIRRIVEEERLRQLSEPESSDGDDSLASATKFMTKAIRDIGLESKKKGTGIKKTTIPIEDAFKQILKQNEELMEDVLTYKPIDLEVIVAFFKSIGLKYKNSEILDFVENECITLKKKWKRTGKATDSV